MMACMAVQRRHAWPAYGQVQVPNASWCAAYCALPSHCLSFAVLQATALRRMLPPACEAKDSLEHAGWLLLQAAWGGIQPVFMVFGKHISSQNPFFYRSLTSEPCVWQSLNMMRFGNEKLTDRFRTNPFWMQYTQCHNGEEPCPHLCIVSQAPMHACPASPDCKRVRASRV